MSNLEDKIVLAHSGWFDSASKKLYKGNSKEVCAISTTKDYITIIELDLRKSKDGILYCYHGTPVQYFFTLKFSWTFQKVQKKYRVNSLEEILDIVTEDKIIFLDIKDATITKEDLQSVFGNKNFKEVILGNKSVAFLDEFKDMPPCFTKILNGNIFCNFYDLIKLRSHGFKYFEVVFPFQLRQKVIDKVAKAGLEFRCSGLFFTKERYWRQIQKYNIKHISSDFI